MGRWANYTVIQVNPRSIDPRRLADMDVADAAGSIYFHTKTLLDNLSLIHI